MYPLTLTLSLRERELDFGSLRRERELDSPYDLLRSSMMVFLNSLCSFWSRVRGNDERSEKGSEPFYFLKKVSDPFSDVGGNADGGWIRISRRQSRSVQ